MNIPLATSVSIQQNTTGNQVNGEDQAEKEVMGHEVVNEEH